MTFGDHLIQLRKKHNLSQEDLASQIHVTRQTISKWELVITVPDMDILIDISKLFSISIDELVGNQEIKKEEVRPRKWVYEYISKRKAFGLPLVHIHFGVGVYYAKGIIAIGNIATGVISIGLLSVGVFTFGLLGLGLITWACFSLGLLMSLGAISIGALAFGGVAIGLFSFGGLSIGLYSFGGCSIAKNIALGGYAKGHIAIGDVCKGVFNFHTSETGTDFTQEELRSTILKEFPHIWRFIVDIFCGFF
ncbi:MAG: helix-turn-helix domain-containing protein [Roseburia sp.]|nr:helix-turn-helix domain-containing protein [Anaeroplasma bactoclasticum]MCM1197176.1 helix-turn-helix domain-containing protein [Roseburia sp.]MCM1557349.1 helix-turn-helix domain-containing protein [Anaeroplasma bactoclasticum]